MSSAPALDNLLALEPLLVAHLRDRLADALPTLVPKVKVLTAIDLAAVTEATQFTPAVHIVYQSYRTVEDRTDGLITRIEQTWLAVVATRNVRNLTTGEAARVDAGQIALAVCQSLMGFKAPLLDGKTTLLSKPLRLTSAPSPGFSAGFQYLPLAFTAELVIKAAM